MTNLGGPCGISKAMQTLFNEGVKAFKGPGKLFLILNDFRDEREA
jgi:hypothetical protein